MDFNCQAVQRQTVEERQIRHPSTIETALPKFAEIAPGHQRDGEALNINSFNCLRPGGKFCFSFFPSAYND